MLKIQLMEIDKHRNETTFRPYMMRYHQFKEAGIEFTVNADSYDIAFVGQASIIDKKKPLDESVSNGVDFVNSINGNCIIVDGQDSTSLIGTIGVFRICDNAKLFLKNSYLKNFDWYKNGYANGRYYWGDGNYSVPDIDLFVDKMKLTGTNWLGTIVPNFNLNQILSIPKTHDISAMFQYPMNKDVYEHDVLQSEYYNDHRKLLIEKLESLKNKYSIQMLENGQRLSQSEYYTKMASAKLVIAPFGFGEMAPRDIESTQFGSILIKPNMDFINTHPNIYVNGETYLACKHDYSDIEDVIEFGLESFENNRMRFLETMIQYYQTYYLNPYDLVVYTHKTLRNHMDGIVAE